MEGDYKFVGALVGKPHMQQRLEGFNGCVVKVDLYQLMPFNSLEDNAKNNITMKILIFKTNIRFKKDLKIIRPLLAAHKPIIKWNVDRQDTDKVLRVESASEDTLEIIKTIKEAGYQCEELPD